MASADDIPPRGLGGGPSVRATGRHDGSNGPTSSAPQLVYETPLGQAWCGDAIETMQRHLASESRDLVITSPPFPLERSKEYGNATQHDYVAWFQPFADEIHRILKPTGSLVLDLGPAWRPGAPVKSLYAFELLISLCRRPYASFSLAQDFYWYNPARLPSPAQWVTVERTRVKDAVNYIWWLGKSAHPDADNRRVLRPYTQAMERLLQTNQYNRGRRPSGHVIGEGFGNDRGGAIPPNLLVVPNTADDRHYAESCRRNGLAPHPARFPLAIPEFFIDFLTSEGGSVCDPFAGSNMSGYAAEAANRHWFSVDLNHEYVAGSHARFCNVQPRLSSG